MNLLCGRDGKKSATSNYYYTIIFPLCSRPRIAGIRNLRNSRAPERAAPATDALRRFLIPAVADRSLLPERAKSSLYQPPTSSRKRLASEKQSPPILIPTADFAAPPLPRLLHEAGSIENRKPQAAVIAALVILGAMVATDTVAAATAAAAAAARRILMARFSMQAKHLSKARRQWTLRTREHCWTR